MRKNIWRKIFLLIIIGVMIVPCVQSMGKTPMPNQYTLSTTWTVDDEGDGDFTSIQDAIDAATDGDIIEVYSGTYYEHVIIGKELEVLGIDAELGSGSDTGKPVVDGSGVGDVVAILKEAGGLHENAEFSGFIVQNSGSSNNRGVYVYWMSVFIIRDNDVLDNSIGIFVERSDRGQITRNTVTNNKWGIIFESADHNTINENVIEDNYEYGMKLDKSPYNAVNLNVFRNHLTTDSVGLSCVGGAKRNDIRQNDFINNHKHAYFANTFNTWNDNYWDNRILPIYFIWGELFSSLFQWLRIPFFQLDMRPSDIPHNN